MAASKNSSAPAGIADLLSRTPPSNREAECSVLGCILLVNETLDQVLNLLRPEHFYDDQNRRIYSAIVSMYERGDRGIDAVTLS